MRLRSGRAGVLALLAAVAGPAAGAWVVTEVPLLPGWTGGVELRDINDLGECCGMGNYVINTSSTAFRFDGTTVTELPHLTPADPITLVTGINNLGVISGYSHNAAGDSQAVYWVGTTLHTIPYPPGANPDADFRAYGINDAGVLVGYFWSTTGERTAFYYRDGESFSLDGPIRAAGLYGLQSATGVNNAGVICGSADDALGIETAWTYDLATGVVTVIGRLGSDNCSARELNLSGQTIGRGKASPLDIYRAVTYDGAWHVVDPAVSATQWGMAINDAGRMLGNADTSANRWSWYSDGPGTGSIVPVSLPGWSRLTLMALNNRDVMVGYGWTATSGGQNRGVVVAPPPGDADHDGDLDAADWLVLTGCVSGPFAEEGFDPPSAACRDAFDFPPGDGDVDLRDVAAFQSGFEG